MAEENHNEAIDREANDRAVAVEDFSVKEDIGDAGRASAAHRRNAVRSQSGYVPLRPEEPEAQIGAATKNDDSSPGRRRSNARLWVLAASSAILLILVTIAGIYLITKKPSTVDQLVILTVPSGAEIKLDSKVYGNSPVKLEQLPIGTYTLTITKDGFEPIVEQITINESQPLERKLIPLPPTESLGLSPEERIKQYQEGAEEAFAKGHYGRPFDRSALHYADSILGLDPTNQYAVELRERIRKAMHQAAQAARERGDFATAQELYATLKEYYTDDEDATIAASRLESQISANHGQVRDLVRKAEEALKAGNLIEPPRASALYFSRQALVIDRQNQQARTVRTQVRDTLAATAEQAAARGDLDNAAKQLEQITQLFPDDKQVHTRLRDVIDRGKAENAKATDPATRRQEGLHKYRRGEYENAIPDLLMAYTNGRNTPEVTFALAYSHLKINRLDQAAIYFRQIPSSDDDTYRSSIAALGDIALRKGNTTVALDHFKQARRLGGSVLYPVDNLDDKIETIEKRQREKAAEPIPLTIQVKHLHGTLKGSCKGTLTVDATGIRYDGSEHTISWNVMGVGLQVTKNKLSINRSNEFSVSPSDAERFREVVVKYQTAANK